jgi:hypothetical protein
VIVAPSWISPDSSARPICVSTWWESGSQIKARRLRHLNSSRCLSGPAACEMCVCLLGAFATRFKPRMDRRLDGGVLAAVFPACFVGDRSGCRSGTPPEHGSRGRVRPAVPSRAGVPHTVRPGCVWSATATFVTDP